MKLSNHGVQNIELQEHKTHFWQRLLQKELFPNEKLGNKPFGRFSSIGYDLTNSHAKTAGAKYDRNFTARNIHGLHSHHRITENVERSIPVTLHSADTTPA